MFDAFKLHQDNGILTIAAASNSNQNNNQKNTYPTNYNLLSIISVTAIDHNNKLARFSNYGKYTVDVAAPGVDIVNTWLGPGAINK